MPNRDGTGPDGEGSLTGRGMGNCEPNESVTNTSAPLGRGRGGRPRGGGRRRFN